MSGIPPRFLDFEFAFAGYVRHLDELAGGTIPDDDAWGGHAQPAYRSGLCSGVALIVTLLDVDERAALVERLEVVFADEIAIWVEHNA